MPNEPVAPRTVYQALVNAGASTVQAIGIMANMINESGFNAGAVGDNGTSFGLVQQHGNYSSLVTGNTQNDLNAQIRTIVANGGLAAANGATGAQAAGNFAANYERCVGCQPGGAQYNSRVSNAATVAGWVSSGKWPTSAGSATAATAGQGSSGLTNTTNDPTCAWGIGGSIPIASSIPLIGSAFQANLCFVHKSTIRHVVAGLLMLSASGAVMLGAVVLAAAAFQKTGALSKAASVAGAVPGGQPVAVAIRTVGSRPRAARPARAAAPEPTSSRRELTDADRARMRARADQISTRVEPS